MYWNIRLGLADSASCTLSLILICGCILLLLQLYIGSLLYLSSLCFHECGQNGDSFAAYLHHGLTLHLNIYHVEGHRDSRQVSKLGEYTHGLGYNSDWITTEYMISLRHQITYLCRYEVVESSACHYFEQSICLCNEFLQSIHECSSWSIHGCQGTDFQWSLLKCECYITCFCHIECEKSYFQVPIQGHIFVLFFRKKEATLSPMFPI